MIDGAFTDATHDAALQSWVRSANESGSDFPIQNLPFGRIRPRGTQESWRAGVAIGDQVLDMRLAAQSPVWGEDVRGLLRLLADDDVNAFMARGREDRRRLRRALSHALGAGSADEAALSPCLLAQTDAEMSLPCCIGDYTDFYAGIHHATAVGKLFRPENPLPANYKWVPIGYHGRASSIIVSGQDFQRPRGQTKLADGPPPTLGPARRLDYELELAMFVAKPNVLGEPVHIDTAWEHIFGFALFNDWSARDIQTWEYQPLGPFLSKNFASTLSPWMATMEALAPFRSPFERPAGDPAPLPYLDGRENRATGAIDIALEVALLTGSMKSAGMAPQCLGRSNFRHAYWTAAQLVVHHTVNGCNLQSGDLLGTGTLSGPGANETGSLLELTQGGRTPISLDCGETRTFLEDGDTVLLRGYCEREGFRRIGFGECRATVLPAPLG